MSGFGNIGPFSTEEVEARHDHIQRMIGRKFPYTEQGCRDARDYLVNKGVSVSVRLTGWEIVKKANDLIQEK